MSSRHPSSRRSRRRRLAVLGLAVIPATAAAVAAGAAPQAHAVDAPLPGATVTSLSGPHPAASAATTAAAAAKGSIVYAKSNNVWIMKGNGSGKRAVTTSGTATVPYRSPSESDTGVIVAARGNYIDVMTQSGQVLNTIDPPMLVDSAGEHLDGPPTEVAISPNGKTIAYSFSWYSCPVALPCGVRLATGYLSTARPTAARYATSLYGMPSWIGNTRTLQTGTTSTVELQDITAPSTHWFYDGDYANPPDDLSDGELSDDGHQLAVVRGWGDHMTVLWYTVNGDATTGAPPAVPTPNCLTNASGGVGSPTWAPGGTAIAYAYPQGVYVLTSPATCGGGAAPKLIAPGGSHPDWSKAALT